jgi:hypothetical protein
VGYVTGNSVVRLPEDAGIIISFTKAKPSLQSTQIHIQFVPEEISSAVKRMRLLLSRNFRPTPRIKMSCKFIRNIQNKK